MKNQHLQKDINLIIESLGNEKLRFENKKIIIIGAFGFIGKYILETLIRINANANKPSIIYALDNFITSNKSFKEYYETKGIICIDHDITNKIDIDTEFDLLISLAGIASPYYYAKYPLETLNASINGLKNMFAIKHNNHSKFVFFSSSEIYGDPTPDKIPTKESYRGNVTSVGPRSCYDESKRVGETLCYIYSNSFNYKTTIIRPFNVFGPGMSLKDYRIIPNITRSVVYGEELKIYNHGNQTRTYCYITDAVNGFMKAICKDEKFGIYNIGNDTGEISVLDLIKIAEKVISKKINYKITEYPKEYPSDEPMRRCPDISNAMENLNYYPKINLKEGLKRHLTWAKENFEN